MQKLKKKYIDDDQVDGQKFLLLNNQYVRALDADGGTKDLFKVNPDSQIEYTEAPIVTHTTDHPQALVTKSQLDDAITKLINLAPETLDTLGELAEKLQLDSTAIFEALRSLQAVEFKKEQIQLSEQDIINGYVDLQHVIKSESIVVFVNRLGLHKDLDFTLSTVNEVTRVTFVNDIASGGTEALITGDYLFFTYSYSNAQLS